MLRVHRTQNTFGVNSHIYVKVVKLTCLKVLAHLEYIRLVFAKKCHILTVFKLSLPPCEDDSDYSLCHHMLHM